MDLPQQEKRIGGRTYRVTKMPLKRGRPLLTRLLNLLGGALAGGVRRDSEDPESGNMMLASILGGTLERIREEDFEFFSSALSEFTEVEQESGQWIRLKSILDVNFRGNYLEMFQWLAFALEVQFGDFFGGLGGLVGIRAEPAAASQSNSPPTSTGSFGA